MHTSTCRNQARASLTKTTADLCACCKTDSFDDPSSSCSEPIPTNSDTSGVMIWSQLNILLLRQRLQFEPAEQKCSDVHAQDYMHNKHITYQDTQRHACLCQEYKSVYVRRNTCFCISGEAVCVLCVCLCVCACACACHSIQSHFAPVHWTKKWDAEGIKVSQMGFIFTNLPASIYDWERGCQRERKWKILQPKYIIEQVLTINLTSCFSKIEEFAKSAYTLAWTRNFTSLFAVRGQFLSGTSFCLPSLDAITHVHPFNPSWSLIAESVSTTFPSRTTCFGQ